VGLDRFSIARAIGDPQATTFLALMTLLYTIIAYYFVWSFASEMEEFEFQSQFEYVDRFVARHSVIIRGVNPDIGTERAARKVGLVFETRFKNQLITC
jgi:hypothetical protein